MKGEVLFFVFSQLVVDTDVFFFSPVSFRAPYFHHVTQQEQNINALASAASSFSTALTATDCRLRQRMPFGSIALAGCTHSLL